MVHLCYFVESQRGGAKWDHREWTVQVNRTDALDGSRLAIRNKEVVLPRRDRLLETFARHMSCDAKVLDEDPETGAKKFRYVRVGENHFSMALTYAWMSVEQHAFWGCPFVVLGWRRYRDPRATAARRCI